jgi:hypothetical protein
MTTLAISHLLHETPAFLQRLNQAFHSFFAGIDEARVLAQRFETLSRLTDDELAAHGLKRQDIPEAVLASTHA